MRKELRIMISLLCLSVAALFWTGCSNQMSQCKDMYPSSVTAPLESNEALLPYHENTDSDYPDCSMNSIHTENEELTDKPTAHLESDDPSYSPQPYSFSPTEFCEYGSSGHCHCNGVIVQARNPKMCLLGNRYPLDIEITACRDVCDVMLTTTLPSGVTLIKSEREARMEGRKVIWQFGHLSKGETFTTRIWLKCEREGQLSTCFCVQATPVAFCTVLCTQPVLICEKRGPTEVCPGQPICYTVTVTNIGSCTARNVLVTDVLPEGVEHGSGLKTLNFRLGDLEPSQTKKIQFSVTACKRGQICNTIVASASNANQTSCEACTCVCCCAIECNKMGPKEVPIGQNADYQINVVNTGDRTLREITVTDSAPLTTTIVTAPGAMICGKQAIWKLKQLGPGETMTFPITLTTCTPGCLTNHVHVETCEGCQNVCTFETNWKGRPALDVCVTSCENPICIEELTQLKIIVTNKGQEYDSNVEVAAHFPPELTPLDASGAAISRIDGQLVEFVPFISLAPDQTLEYYITVKANASGDLRPKIEVRSDFIKNPITQEESLIVN